MARPERGRRRRRHRALRLPDRLGDGGAGPAPGVPGRPGDPGLPHAGEDGRRDASSGASGDHGAHGPDLGGTPGDGGPHAPRRSPVGLRRRRRDLVRQAARHPPRNGRRPRGSRPHLRGGACLGDLGGGAELRARRTQGPAAGGLRRRPAAGRRRPVQRHHRAAAGLRCGPARPEGRSPVAAARPRTGGPVRPPGSVRRLAAPRAVSTGNGHRRRARWPLLCVVFGCARRQRVRRRRLASTTPAPMSRSSSPLAAIGRELAPVNGITPPPLPGGVVGGLPAGTLLVAPPRLELGAPVVVVVVPPVVVVVVVPVLPQPVTQNTLYLVSAPCDPSAWMVSLTWTPCSGCGSMPVRSSV